MKKLLIDGDIILYRATASAETEWNIEGDLWLLYSDLAQSKAILHGYLIHLLADAGVEEAVFAFSGKGNFRKDIYPEYKANRANTRKPLAYSELKEWVSEEFPTIVVDGIEADDVLGLYADDYILVSEDKDLMTVPSTHFIDKSKEYKKIDTHLANYNWMCQTLTGDTTDNYKGCPKIGAKTAEKLLAGINCDRDFNQAWDVVVSAFSKAGLTEDDAILNAQMARILRKGDFDLVSKELNLWTPNSGMN